MRIAFFGDSLTSGVPGSSYFSMLRGRLPGYTLINLGRGNDTVVSLYRRLSHLRFDEPFDVAFLWIGVNDVSPRTSWLYRLLNTAVGQRRAKDLDEFRTYYQSSLDLVCRNAERVITVPPVLRGEDIHNRWNGRIEVLSHIIEELTLGRKRAEFLDLRTGFLQKLASRPISDYVPSSPIRVALDALTLRDNDRIDRKAAERGLHLTLDGLHLNSVGAGIAADQFVQRIQKSQ